MEYFAGLDVSMKETHICVMDRDGKVALDAKAATSPAATAVELAKAPAVKRIVFETGRMAPALYHGLEALGLPVVCIENRHAYQALRSLATHKTDRNDARGLAHLARTGFFKPVHVKSLPSHAVRALIIARKKLVGQRVTIENQIRGLALVFGVRLPRGLSPTFADEVKSASGEIAGLSSALQGLVPRRWKSGEIDYTGSISKIGDRRLRTLLYEAANVMLTRYRGDLTLKDWALRIGKRSTMRKARVALARRLAIIMHAMLRDGTDFHGAQSHR